ncbi:Glycosyl transferase family 2 [Saccharicrinis carchari]|uniref:Glycosyl transferase family 2 n=1 Tax=Saccharicrinis carchari TaxID=1168039 RepID=A0A521AKL1_SACCC|nr:glycosyltransferase family 2 protein [Saccharicrinis carchari]SMO35323.1 Glycosyl transferase family 2 [Saccharicrinis carchari]
MPKVSVYIPLYNREQSIGKAIEGLLQQSYKDFELIIIDDGSTDNSIEVVNKYNDKRIKVYQNSENKGVVYTRNRAFELASGEYLAINDSDDYSLPERLEKQVKFLDSNAQIGILGGKALRIDHLGEKRIWEYPNEPKNIKCRLFWGSSMINSTLMMRLKMMIENNLRYDENFPVAEDYDIFERAQNCFELRNLDEVLVKYYSHPANLTYTQNELMVNKAFEINMRQLTKLGVILNQIESEIWFKLFSYDFNFNKASLVILSSLGEKLIRANNQLMIYDENIFANQLSQRIYECLYHTKKYGSYKSFTKSTLMLHKSLSPIERMKFYISQFR